MLKDKTSVNGLKTQNKATLKNIGKFIFPFVIAVVFAFSCVTMAFADDITWNDEYADATVPFDFYVRDGYGSLYYSINLPVGSYDFSVISQSGGWPAGVFEPCTFEGTPILDSALSLGSYRIVKDDTATSFYSIVDDELVLLGSGDFYGFHLPSVASYRDHRFSISEYIEPTPTPAPDPLEVILDDVGETSNIMISIGDSIVTFMMSNPLSLIGVITFIVISLLGVIGRFFKN